MIKHSLLLAQKHKRLIQVAVLSVVSAIALMMIGSTAWRAYTRFKLVPVIFETATGDYLSVTAEDTHGNRIAEFMAPAAEVFLPKDDIRLEVVAPHRLAYKRQMDASSLKKAGVASPAILLEAPQSHRWMLDDILWYESVDVRRNGKATNCCVVLRSDGLCLVNANSGQVLWNFQDPEKVEWGHATRGRPATFQPDRFVIINDSESDGRQKIVFAHPSKAVLLCLSVSDGKELWRSDLLESAGIQTPTAASVCPIVLQEFVNPDGLGSSLNVVVAAHDPNVTTSSRRLLSVDPATGKVQWHFDSLQDLKKSAGAIDNQHRPLHLQWGDVERRPSHLGDAVGSYYFDDYSIPEISLGLKNPNDLNARLGTDRPISIRTDSSSTLHWIDGSDWQAIDPQTGKLLANWKLLDDCVCPPKLLRIGQGKTLVLTVNSQTPSKDASFVAWDLQTNQVAWTQTMECDLNRLPQSFLSRDPDFPLVVDLDGDGVDEWIAPSHFADSNLSRPMTPPYGMVLAHRGIDGEAIWAKPFHVPNFDGMIERAVAVSDMDGDGWKDLLLGTRFQGGGVRKGVACFLDLVSGKTGDRIWQSQVRTESHKRTYFANELVDLSVLEERDLIAVQTYSGSKGFGLLEPRPYSTTFLDLATGSEQAFALGVSARAFGKDTWIEHRLPPAVIATGDRPPPGKLLGWAYPESRMWSVEDSSPVFCRDLNRDSFQEVVTERWHHEGSECVMYEGLTGKKLWTKKTEHPRQVHACFPLERDFDNDGFDELVTFTSDFASVPGAVKTESHAALLEVISGATGVSLWKHATDEVGWFHCVAYLNRDLDKLPLLLYQNNQSKRVTCIDLGSRKAIWNSDEIQGDFTWWRDSLQRSQWNHDGIVTWFSIMKTESGNVASFVNAETGAILSRVPLDLKQGGDAATIQRVVQPAWIRWGGRELLAVQSISTIEIAGDTEYRVDVRLFDKSRTLVSHWTESLPQPKGSAFSHWIKTLEMFRTPPTKVVTSSGEERLCIVTAIDESIGLRLLSWDETKVSKLTLDRTVKLPIAPNSKYAFVAILDCDGDGKSDFVASSDDGVVCSSLDAEAIWRHAPIDGWLVGTFKHQGEQYIQFSTAKKLNASTGQQSEILKGIPYYLFTGDKPVNSASVITYEWSPVAKMSAIRVPTKAKSAVSRQSNAASDPRYVRLLPWVIEAKAFLWSTGEGFRNYSWLRILKLAFGVFLIPTVVVWKCARRQIGIRDLLLIATSVALALGLVIADKNAYPTKSQSQDDYLGALLQSMNAAILIANLTLPFIELIRVRWRRLLSLSLYGFFVVGIPIFNLVAYPHGAIQTTYTYQEFWHLFWMALIPTGIVLFLIHGLRTIFRMLLFVYNGVAKRIRRKLPAWDKL